MRIILFDIDYTLFDKKVFKETNRQTYHLYKDTVTVLHTLQTHNKLGIFSEGEGQLQKSKLDRTDISHLFAREHTHIVPVKDDSIEKVFSQYQNDEVIFVDDKLPLLEQVKRRFPNVNVVWMKQGLYADTQKILPHFSPNAIIM